MRLIRTLSVCAASLVLVLGPSVGAGTAGAATTIVVEPVRTGLGQPVAFTVAEDGQVWFVSRRSGTIRILDPASGATKLFADIDDVDGHGERGAMGLVLHPDYPEKPFVYVYVTRTVNGIVSQDLIRLRSDGAQAIRQRILFSWTPTDIKFHNGGKILFGPDGKLYVATGDNGDPATSQDLNDLRGKVLRVGPAGAAPASNPFGSRVWAFGIRNSIGMDVDPLTGSIWGTDNGPSCNDEVNLLVAGGNFAWGPSESCPEDPNTSLPEDTNRDGPEPRQLPVTRIADTVGITGAVFCTACGLGEELEGDLLFGDVSGGIWDVDLDATRTGVTGPPTLLTTAPVGVFSMESGPDGTVYFSSFDGIYRLTAAA